MSNTQTASAVTFLRPTQTEASFNLVQLLALVNQVQNDAKTKLNSISNLQSSVSISDMFAMQMLMNHLSQMSEMAAAVVTALNTAMNSLTRGIKGG